jgi:putative protease
MEEVEIGRITHYFSKIQVGVARISGRGIKVGDVVHIKGHSTDFFQKIESMQIEHKPVEEAKSGEEVAFKVDMPVREHDVVFKVIE